MAWPSWPASFSARMRAGRSAGPRGGTGTTRRMGRVGYPPAGCARQGTNAVAPASANSARRVTPASVDMDVGLVHIRAQQGHFPRDARVVSLCGLVRHVEAALD